MGNFISDKAKVLFSSFKQDFKIDRFPVDDLGRQLPGIPVRLQVLEIDIVKSRTITYENDITENPVEDGTVITDHIIERPVEIAIDGIISTASLSNSLLGNILSGENPLKSNKERIQDAFNALKQLRIQKLATIIETPYGEVFMKMFIKSLSISQVPQTGDALRFNVIFKQIKFVASQVVNVSKQVAVDTAKPTTNYGRQPAEEGLPTGEIGIVDFLGTAGKRFFGGG